VDPEARFARVSAAAAVDVDVEGLVEGQAPAYGCGALTGTGGS
jgi:hypothetical protein